MNYLRNELYELLKTDDAIFDFIQSSSLDGLWYWDLENMEEEWMNEKFWTTLGYDPTKMPHKAAAWQDIIFQEDLELASQNAQKHLLDANYPYDQVVRYRHFDGSTVWIRCRGLAIRDKMGTPTRMLGAHTDISAIKRKESLLEETSKVAKVGAWEINLETNELYWSDITKIIHEVPLDFVPDLAEGINFYKEGESRTIITECVDKAIVDGTPWDVELQLVTQKGNEVWVRAIGQTKFHEGKCIRIFGTFQDINARKFAAQKLAQSEEQFRQTFDNAVIGMTLVDKKGKWIRVNDSFCQLVGYSRTELLKSGYRNLVHPDELEESNRELTQFAKGEIEVYSREKRYIHKKGHVIYLVIGVSKVTNEEGRISQFVAQYADITDRKLATQKLQQSELEFRQIFENSVSGMALVNTKGRWIKVNDSFCELIGYSRAELLKRSFTDLIHPAFLSNTIAELRKLERGEIAAFKSEEQFIHKNGTEIWFLVAVSKVTTEEGKIIHYIAQYSDITERKKADEKMRRLSILEAKSKEMEQFTYIASHDLREPLTNITGYLNLLIEEFADQMPEDAQHILQFTSEAAGRMDELIHGLLDYSRLGRVRELEQVACQAVLKDVLADLSGKISRLKAQIKIDALPIIPAYQLELKLLFQNLIGNALKFAKAGTTPNIHISVTKIEDGWQFCVKDEGIGIPESEKEKIFFIFQRLHKQDFEGTGIGLANCKKIADLHNGTIWVESALGQGSAFYFTIKTEDE